MKKFYYKKEISLDKTPIILRLERRRTVNVAKDAGQEEQGRLSARATSISGLDQLKYDPSLPRTRSREVTKSLSEDVLSSSSRYSTPSAVVITEAELSSSWLYKNMKAAVNSKVETDNKTTTSSEPTQQEQDLTPMVLQDPKMKPIPVPVIGRSKKASSCCCYLAIMIIISLCTIGFLSTIGGILYMELISNGNRTIYPEDETTDVVLSFRNAPLQDLENITEVDDQAEADHNLDKKVKYESDNRNDAEITEVQQTTIHILDFGKPLGAELSQYIDNTRTEIILRNESSKIYEENLNDSVKYEQNSNASPSNAIKQNSQGTNIQRNPSEMAGNVNQSKADLVKIDIDEKVVKVTETDANLKSDPNKNSVLNEEEIYLDLNLASNSNAAREDIKQTKTGVELKSEVFIESERDEESTKQINAEKIRKELNLENFSLPVSNELIDSEITDTNADDKRIINYPNESLSEQVLESLDKSATELKSAIESLPTDRNVHENLDKTNVGESMVLVIDDPEYDSHQEDSREDTFISNRNGDLPISGIPHSRTKTSARIKTGDRQSGLSTVDLYQRFRQQVKPGEIQTPKKPINKVTVAEVMKQLKVLDVNNKLSSFRMKSVKPNIKKIKRPPKNIPRKELPETLEKLQYLEKLRVMLYDRLQ